MKFPELKAKYGLPKDIPNRELYDCINAPETRGLLIEKFGILGEEDFKKYELVQEVRRRAKRDLLFLAKYFLWETNPESVGNDFSSNQMSDTLHQMMCDMYVTKDDSKSVAEQDVVYKNRLILAPRGSMKSTLDIADIVSWILNFYTIRILILTAAEDLAVKFLDLTKGHFQIKEHEPSLMNIYFPEFCVTAKDLGKMNAFSFVCPLWSAQKVERGEPTVMASSIASTLSGFHFEVIKPDDAVSNKNTESDEQCKKVIKNFFLNRKMLRPFGYVDLNGTRYSDEDLYGSMLDKLTGDVRVERGPCWEIHYSEERKTKILIARAWEPNRSSQAMLDDGRLKPEELRQEHYDLLFPEVLTYADLHKMQKDDEISFEGQMNQNPRPLAAVTFDIALLKRATVHPNDLPVGGPISITWDFAFSDKKGRDYSTACAALWTPSGEAFILDLIRKRFTPDALAEAFVHFVKTWRPYVVGVENVAGSRFIESAILQKAFASGDPLVYEICRKIDWFKPDNQAGAKKTRTAMLHPWLAGGKMKFASNLPHLDVLYREFERCQQAHHHEDIPDVISFQQRYAPAMSVRAMNGGALPWGLQGAPAKEQAEWNLLFEENCDPFGVPGSGPSRSIVVTAPDGEDGRSEGGGVSGLENILGSGIFA